MNSFRINDITAMIPETLISIMVTLALSFLIGLEREERHAKKGYYNFGGVRTFPIIGLSGYLIARISNADPVAVGAGLVVLGTMLWQSYRKKLELSASAGMTSEVSGLFTFLLGVLVYKGALWEAATLAVITLLLLELKGGLERLARKIPPIEIFTFTRFLLLTAVILPVVPDRDFTEFHLNPFRTWLIVVAISGLSYTAYGAARLAGQKPGLMLSAALGGIYSSTATTVMLAKRSRNEGHERLFSGAILVSSAFMYFRLIALLLLFNAELGRRLVLPFLLLGTLAGATGAFWARKGPGEQSGGHRRGFTDGNPLELKAAFLFAMLFLVMGVLTKFVQLRFGTGGIYGLSFLAGMTDVDPFVMSLTQSSGSAMPADTSAACIVIATASNNLMKGVYAAVFARGSVRRHSLLLLALLSFAALGALFWL